MGVRSLACTILCVVAIAAPLGVTGAGATESVAVDRVAGPDRYQTAADVAAEAFPDGATDAVLARGDAFPDALAGSFLAGDVDGPVLLTGRNTLSAATADALEDLDVVTVHVLGGTGAVSKAVVDRLVADGYEVNRVAGPNRYATAAKIAVEGAASVGEIDDVRTAIVASGADFPDALAAGPLAFAAGVPILLTSASALDPDTADALTRLEIGHVLVLGGDAAVSGDVIAAIEELGATSERLAGDDRAATAAAVATFAVERLTWNGAAVTIARGDAFPDGLAGGPYGGQTRAPVLLTDPGSLSPATATWLTEHADTVGTITALGGDAAVSDAVLEEASVAAGGASSTTFAVSGGQQFVALGEGRTCTVTTPGHATVELRLFPGESVTETVDAGQLTFVDGEADGLADVGAPQAVISSVNGRTVSPASAGVSDVDSDGTVDVVLTSTAYDSVVLVAFVDAEGGAAGALEVGETGAPVEEAAAGCRTAFAPPEAPSGSHLGTVVESVDADESLFVAAGRSFLYRADDTYESEGQASTVSDFAALLSAGDVLDVNYAPSDAEVSTFTVTTDTVKAVGTPIGVVTVRDVEVSFSIPDSNGAGTTYRVTRTRTHAAGDGCSSNIAQTATTMGITDASPFLDPAVPDGCYMYRVLTVASNGTIVQSAFSVPVEVPGSPPAGDTVRPIASFASVSDSGTTGRLGAGDTATIAFSEPMATPPPGAALTVTSNGVSATFTAGSGSTYSLNGAAVIVGGQSRAANTVLTIVIGTDPATPVVLPAELTATSGINDLAGNAWNLVGSSDRTLEASA